MLPWLESAPFNLLSLLVSTESIKDSFQIFWGLLRSFSQIELSSRIVFRTFCHLFNYFLILVRIISQDFFLLWKFIIASIFPLVFGLLSLSFEMCGACSLCASPSLLTYLTRLSIVFFPDVIFVKKIFVGINLKQLVWNLFLGLLSGNYLQRISSTTRIFPTCQTLYLLLRKKNIYHFVL